jgi:tRNA-Thr(GGU) m(6)t(6)A37 methyltransferase TsaA
MMGKVVYMPIGVIHSPFESPQDVPIQAAAARGVKGSVEVAEKYEEGLKDVEGFSHLILVYHFHLAQEYSLLVKPFMDDERHGLFATRAPSRPNSVGVSVVRFNKRKKTFCTYRMWT